MNEQSEKGPAPEPAGDAIVKRAVFVEGHVDQVEVTIQLSPEKRRPVHELVAEHVATPDDAHDTVREHLDRRGIVPQVIVEPRTKQPHLVLPHWQERALLERFRAAGIHDGARIPNDVFERALHETLHGRI